MLSVDVTQSVDMSATITVMAEYAAQRQWRMSQDQKDEARRLKAEGLGCRDIGARMGVSPSCISYNTREVAKPKKALKPATAEFGLQIMEHYRVLHDMAAKWTRDLIRAEDLVHETIAQALQYESTFEPGTNLLGWLVVLMKSRFHDMYRRTKNLVEDPEGFHAARLSHLPNQGDVCAMRSLAKAIASLSPPYRTAIIMVAVLGHSYEDTAIHCGATVGTIKSRVFRGREMLMHRMKMTADDFVVDAVLAAASA